MSAATSPASFSIRPLTEEDRAWLSTYLHDQWDSDVMAVHGVVYHVAQLPGFVAERGDEPVGLLTYQIDGVTCEIVTLDCREKHRGIGSALIGHMVVEARAWGCDRLWLTTTNDNLDALRFYQRRGFRLEAVHPGAVDRARELKPSIPLVGEYDIVIRDEIQLGMSLTGSDNT